MKVTGSLLGKSVTHPTAHLMPVLVGKLLNGNEEDLSKIQPPYNGSLSGGQQATLEESCTAATALQDVVQHGKIQTVPEDLQEAKLLSCSRGTEVVVTRRMGTPALLLLQGFVLAQELEAIPDAFCSGSSNSCPKLLPLGSPSTQGLLRMTPELN
ncbi:hypothetical protein DV515_00009892 [Chloebia gouldiae]|uniref:Uncharacterized protein n=1 Tax=Chloebia gouldiae TaxID=44316 RepID=A0A3L8SAH8_CHLGU|nr:hypothetical protein DV515_00009892 [Chloebia gouldiae]